MSNENRQHNNSLTFELIDLPFGGKDIDGEILPEDLGLENEDRLAFLKPLQFHLHLVGINANSALLVQGKISTTARIVCDRCDCIADISLVNDDVCHEYENVFGTVLDLTDDIREDILFALPQHFLCKEDCKGFCLRCGQNLNLGSCNCPEEEPESDENDDNSSPWDCLDNLKIQ